MEARRMSAVANGTHLWTRCHASADSRGREPRAARRSVPSADAELLQVERSCFAE